MVSEIWASVKKHFFFKVLIVLCIAACFCLINFYLSDFNASGRLSLNYTWASSGQHINHTRFNVNEIKKEKVMTEALKKAGLSDTMTPQELASCLSIEPSTARAPENGYIATEYRLKLELDKKLPMSAYALLDLILNTYIDMTYENYIGNYAMIDFEEEDITKRNYNEISIILDTQAQLFQEYMNTRRGQDNEFISTETGENFASMSDQFGNFSNITLEKFNAYIVGNGLTKDSKLPATLKYKNVNLQNDFDRFSAQYDERVKGIKRYDTTLSAVVMIPTLDASNEFYMSKTKMGIDYLSEKADIYLVKKGDTGREISYNKEWLDNIAKKDATKQMYSKADSMVNDMIEELSALEEKALKTDRDYIDTKLSKSMMYYVFAKPDMIKFQLKKAIILAVSVWLVITLVQYIIIVKKKKEREAYEKDSIG